MTTSDFFFVSAGISILVLTATWIFIFYKILLIVAKIELEILSVRNVFKISGLKLLSKLLGLIKGDENEKRKSTN